MDVFAHACTMPLQQNQYVPPFRNLSMFRVVLDPNLHNLLEIWRNFLQAGLTRLRPRGEDLVVTCKFPCFDISEISTEISIRSFSSDLKAFCKPSLSSAGVSNPSPQNAFIPLGVSHRRWTMERHHATTRVETILVQAHESISQCLSHCSGEKWHIQNFKRPTRICQICFCWWKILEY